ncbi:MAG: hypothetical protein AAF580_04955 [Pseudomonadota bacterium]
MPASLSDRWPALMYRNAAEAYVSRTGKRFDDLHIKPVRVGQSRMWRRMDLDNFIASLPHAEEEAQEGEGCRADEAFGCSSHG